MIERLIYQINVKLLHKTMSSVSDQMNEYIMKQKEKHNNLKKSKYENTSHNIDINDQMNEYKKKQEEKHNYSNKLKTINAPNATTTNNANVNDLHKINVDDLYKINVDVREENFLSNANVTNDNSYVLYSIDIDLRIYGDDPDKPYEIMQYGHTIYFTQEQKKIIKEKWFQIKMMQQLTNLTI